MKLMAGIILAVAISVHTVVAWDFAMAIAPMWHSTIFGPYFVVGAIFSGIAALLLSDGHHAEDAWASSCI